jgi:magnesium transporter
MITIHATRGDTELLLDVKVEDLPQLLGADRVSSTVNVWVDLSGDMDDASLHLVRDIFKFHPLAIEDCFELRDHPKVEPFPGYLYVITHGLTAGSTPEETETIELDVFLGHSFLVTYHVKPSRSVAAVEDLTRRGGDLLRRGPTHLLHALLERQVDGIEPVLDAIEERIAGLEERVLATPRNEDLGVLLALRRSTLHLRRWMFKQRDIMLRLARGEFPHIAVQDLPLFRDIHDHLWRFTDLLESYRELTISVQEAYLTMTNTRLNEVMRFLTVFTSLLTPLMVITGIYGMNFEYMPELRQSWGYPAVLIVMGAVSGTLLWFFRRRGWLGRPRLPRDTTQ